MARQDSKTTRCSGLLPGCRGLSSLLPAPRPSAGPIVGCCPTEARRREQAEGRATPLAAHTSRSVHKPRPSPFVYQLATCCTGSSRRPVQHTWGQSSGSQEVASAADKDPQTNRPAQSHSRRATTSLPGMGHGFLCVGLSRLPSPYCTSDSSMIPAHPSIIVTPGPWRGDAGQRNVGSLVLLEAELVRRTATLRSELLAVPGGLQQHCDAIDPGAVATKAADPLSEIPFLPALGCLDHEIEQSLHHLQWADRARRPYLTH